MTLFDRMIADFFDTDVSTYNYATPMMRTNTDNDFSVELALPGFSKKDVNIEVEGRNLIISAEIEKDDETRFKKSFRRVYTLPNSVDPEKIEGSLEHGILNLTLGKSETIKKINLN